MDDLDLFLDDKITEEEFTEKFNKLPKEEQEKVEAKVKAEKMSTFTALKALRKEKNRVENKAQDPADTGKKFREEQVEKAKNRLQTEYSIEDMKPIEDAFARNDNGSVDSDNIFANLEQAFAFVNHKQLLDSRSKIKQFENNAEDFLDQMAQPNGSGDGSGDGKKYDPKAHELVRAAKKQGMTLTLDEAQRSVTQGLIRTY